MRTIEVVESADPAVMKYVSRPDVRPSPTQIVVDVRAAGVNPVDTYIRGGGYNFDIPTLPYTPGFDCSGTVREIGSAVSGFAIGDRVFSSSLNLAHRGTYAELAACQASRVPLCQD